MFCIRSDVITLGSIEMYGSHDMRHTGFHRLTVVNGTPGFWGVTTWYQNLGIRIPRARWGMGLGHAVNV